MRAPSRFPRRLRNQRGTALTELAIVAPVFMLIILWQQTLLDTAVVKLKAQEAARFAAWEFTALRTEREIQDDVRARFTDLKKANIQNNHATLTYHQAQVYVDTAGDRRAALEGNITRPSGGGLLGSIMRFLTGLVSGALDWAIRRMDLQQNGRAEVGVSMKVTNTLIPAASTGETPTITRIETVRGIRDSRVKTLDQCRGAGGGTLASGKCFADGYALTFDTMKAWPNNWARRGGRSNDEDPRNTYPVVESQTAQMLSRVAFFGVQANFFFNLFDRVARFLGLPSPLPSTPRTWQNRGGPIFMGPAEPATSGFSPQPNAVQRLGEQTRVTTAMWTTSSPDPGTDRSRFGVPGAVHTAYWTNRSGNGGIQQGPPSFRRNDATRALACRGHFFRGNPRAQEADMPRRCR